MDDTKWTATVQEVKMRYETLTKRLFETLTNTTGKEDIIEAINDTQATLDELNDQSFRKLREFCFGTKLCDYTVVWVFKYPGDLSGTCYFALSEEDLNKYINTKEKETDLLLLFKNGYYITTYLLHQLKPEVREVLSEMGRCYSTNY